MDKYELTNVSKVVTTPHGEAMVYQIQALIDLPSIGVKAGDVGGYIGTEACLGQANECWVFEGSSVVRGSQVKNRAQIKGKSFIFGHSIVRGRAIVEDSEILEGTVVQGSSYIHESDVSEKSVISGTSEVVKARLRNVKLVDGKIINSTIQSRGKDKLMLEKNIDIDFCDMDIQAESPIVMRGLQMKNVKAYDVVEFRILEKTVMKNLVFDGETYITVGKPNSPAKNRTNLIGVEDGLLFDGVELSVMNSNLLGQGELKGKIELEDTTVQDLISITNDMEDPLHLHHVHASECVSFYKYCLKGRTSITNEKLRGDIVITA